MNILKSGIICVLSGDAQNLLNLGDWVIGIANNEYLTTGLLVIHPVDRLLGRGPTERSKYKAP